MADESRKIPLVLVTGFLGSGKTTLLNRLIGRYRERRLGVIVNDFGPLAVDAELVRSRHGSLGQIVEIAGGSIFCSCLAGDFLEGLVACARARPEVVLVETSGLSDPSNINRLLRHQPELRDAFRLQSIFCLLDAESFPDLCETVEAVRRQLEACDIAVLNKTDLVDGSALERVRQSVRACNPRALLVEARYADIDLALLDREAVVSPGCEGPTLNRPESRPDSLLLEEPLASPERLEGFLKAVEGRVLRIKGFCLAGGASWYVDGTKAAIRAQAAAERPRTLGLSIICRLDATDAIWAEWRKALA
jgi:G3E family GTPase